MTERQLNKCKDDILDLLGYGVEPEYLGQRCTNSLMLYYAFTELHLRLPRNLNVNSHFIHQLLHSSPQQMVSSDLGRISDDTGDGDDTDYGDDRMDGSHSRD